jgi:hypothetical protein
MTDSSAVRTFLSSEIDALEPFAWVAAAPTGQPLHAVEVTRLEDASLEVRVPGRPPIVPELPVENRSALRERGFSSEDPADPTQPWKKSVPDAASAVSLLQTIHVEVFGEKPDTTLDIAHGSHKPEHDARLKLARTRTRIESIVTDIQGKAPEKDEDGDYVLAVKDVHVMIAPRAALDGHVVVRVFAICNVGVQVTPELGLFLARLNFGMMFGRFALDTDHRSIWFDESILGEEFREEELRFAIDMVASTADGWDDRFKQMFGGATYQEVLAGRAGEPAPTTKPGQGVGQYL